MDYCVIFGVLAVVVLLITFIGHGLWLFVASIVNAAFGAHSPEYRRRQGRRVCAACGCPFPQSAHRCPECGLFVDDPVARELRRLEQTAKCIEDLVEHAALDPAVGEEVYRGLEKRQHWLISGKSPEAGVAQNDRAEDQPWQVIERLLGSCRDVRDLPLEQRKRALACYRAMEKSDRPHLSPPALLTLARLLRVAGLNSRALGIYQVLAATHAQASQASTGALEAAYLTIHEGHNDQAKWFLQLALSGNLPERERREAEELLGSLPKETGTTAACGLASETDLASAKPQATSVPLPLSPSSAPPRRSFGQMLAGFMEERNILWGELVGGLLIVGCSIALVISLWSKLEQIPYFPFAIFAMLTTAIFGAGLYTLSHWKLESTSRGLLVIATLLTPLDFLILAGILAGRWHGQEAGVLDWLIQAVAVVGFSFLVRRSGQVLFERRTEDGGRRAEGESSGFSSSLLPPPSPLLLTLAVVGASASQLLTPYLIPPTQSETGPLALVSFAPILFLVAGLAPVLLGLSRRLQVESAPATALFLFLGTGVFAVAVAIGFLIHWTDNVSETLLHLALPIAVAGMPLLVSGSLLHRLLDAAQDGPGCVRSEEPPATQAGGPVSLEVYQPRGLSLTLIRVIGTVIGIAGMAIMLAALILAWREPASVMKIGFLNCAVFTLVTLRYRLPYANIPAVVCLTIAYLTAYLRITGDMAGDERLTLNLLNTAVSGTALAFLAMFLGLVSEGLVRLGRRLDGLYHVFAAAAIAVPALVLVGRHSSVTEPARAALVFGLCGAGALLVNVRWRQIAATYAGSVTILGAIVYVLLWTCPELRGARLWVFALLIQATWSTLFYLAFERSQREKGRKGEGEKGSSEPPEQTFSPSRLLPSSPSSVLGPYLAMALMASLLAILPLLSGLGWDWLGTGCICTFWIAAIWVAIAWREVWPGWFAAAQAAVCAGTLLGLSEWLWYQSWVATPRDLSTLWSVQTYLLGLGALGLIWEALRFGLSKNRRAQGLLEPGWPTVDMVTFPGVVAAQLAVAGYMVLRDVKIELFSRAFSQWVPADVPQPLDVGYSWALLAILAMGLAIAFLGRRGAVADASGSDGTVADASGSEWRPGLAILCGVTLGLTVPVLGAEWFREEHTATLALIWGLSLYFLVVSVLLWRRETLLAWSQRLGVDLEKGSIEVAGWSRVILVIGAVTPVCLLAALVAGLVFAGIQPVAMPPAALFAKVGLLAGLAVPLVLLSVAFVGQGVRENSPAAIFFAGLLVLANVMGGRALSVVLAGSVIDGAEAVFIVQLGIVVAGVWALGGIISGRWLNAALLVVQIGLTLIPCVALLALALGPVLLDPAGKVPGFVIQTGQALGWVGALLALGALFALADGRLRLGAHAPSRKRSVDVLALGGMMLGVLASCAVAALSPNCWLAYHVLTLAGTLLGLLLLAGGWIGATAQHLGPMLWPQERRARAAEWLKNLLPARRTQIWLDVVSALVVLLALRGAWGDPGKPYWSTAAALAVAVLIGAQAVWVRRPAYVYASGLLLNLVGYLVWQAWAVENFNVQAWMLWGPGVFDRFLFIQILCLAGSSTCWSLIDWRLRLGTPPIDLRARFMPFPHAAVWLALHLLAMLVLTALGSDVFELKVRLGGSLAWTALLATLLALLICLWDAESSLWGLPAGPLYAFGLLTLGFILHQTAPPPRLVGWTGGLMLASYMLATNVGIRLAPWLVVLKRLLRLPSRSESMLALWYRPTQVLMAGVVLGLSVWISLNFATLPERLAGPLTVVLVALALVVVRPLWPGEDDKVTGWQGDKVTKENGDITLSPCHLVTLSLLVAAAVECCWALYEPGTAAIWLQRNALVFAVLSLITVTTLTLPSPSGRGQGEGAGAVPGGAEWVRCARRLGPILAILTAVMLACVLVQELLLYDTTVRRCPLEPMGKYLVALVLIAGVLGGLWVAVSARNLLSLSVRNRVWCVWAAEFVFALLLLHLRLNVPDLFPSFLGKNWTFVLMALGFVGVGLGEVLRRYQLPMLARPAWRTGLVLPFVPLLAFPVRSLRGYLHMLEKIIPGLSPIFIYLDRLPSEYGLHALLWFLLGLLYAVVALLRRASAYALLAALFANFGLWVLFANQDGWEFTLHPQVWLIPLGAIVLMAEFLHRERLTEAQARAVRYVGLLLIYVSSTADMFIAGLGHSVMLPIVLALLAVAGVLAGILLRVRAFLFLGVAFLFLVVFSQIWHAAVDRQQTWVWWASGIVLGAAILTLFALFEKRRNDLLRMIEEVKSWR